MIAFEVEVVWEFRTTVPVVAETEADAEREAKIVAKDELADEVERGVSASDMEACFL